MMGRVALGMTVRLKLRRQFNVPSSMSMGEAVERIVAESARRNAMYQRNVRALHRVVEQIESRARDFLTIRERMREAQLAFCSVRATFLWWQCFPAHRWLRLASGGLFCARGEGVTVKGC